MTKDVENWKYNKRDQIEALTTEQLMLEWEGLTKQIQNCNQLRLPWTDEMSWLFFSLVREKTKREIKNIL